ncbi:MAG: hypothetical protein LAT56_16510 [Wenzhouxiangella sp.]|nr:hypothetical protein [Wenzhouxiangella sp.]
MSEKALRLSKLTGNQELSRTETISALAGPSRMGYTAEQGWSAMAGTACGGTLFFCPAKSCPMIGVVKQLR